MALAIVEFDYIGANSVVFRFDIGQNRYYSIAVGRRSKRRRSGIEVLDDFSYESPLLGPLKESAMGRGFVEVPQQAFDRKHRYVQLVSYRNKDLEGLAISSPIRPPAVASSGAEPDELAPLAFAKETDMDTLKQNSVETVGLGFSEKPPYSDAMFLGALMGGLQSILPIAGKLLGPLLGGLTGGGPGGGGKGAAGASGSGLDALLKAIASPEAIKQITNLVKQVAAAKSVVAALPTTSGHPKNLSYSARVAGPRRYSEAQIAPALLAALPALMPILKQVLTPQTIKTVIDAPNKPLGMIINGIKDFAKLGLEADKQEIQHLERLNPGVDDRALDALLASMSMSFADRTEMKYRRVSSVRLNFENVQTTKLYGRARIPYLSGRALSFPLTIETPKPIRHAVLQLVVKDPQTLEVLYHRKYRVEQVESGRLLMVPALDETEAKTLKPGEEYLVSAVLVWKNRKAKKRGTSITQRITLVAEYSFDRVEESGEPIPLNDVSKFREFWHKVWGGTFTDNRKRIHFDCKYYYRLNADRDRNARIETKTRTTERERKRVTGRLKTGMELSPDEMNRLIPRLKPTESTLDEQQLAALKSDDFADRFNQAARYQAKFRGRPGDSAALWVYPEFKLQNVVLSRPNQANPNGHVTQFTEHVVKFPIPIMVHFIGVRTP